MIKLIFHATLSLKIELWFWRIAPRYYFFRIWGEWVIVLFNGNSAIVQLYHGENKLIFNEMMRSAFVLDQHAELEFIVQQSVDRHVAPLGHILSQPVCSFSLMLRA